MKLRLKEILKEKEITAKELADRLNVSENTISFISTGKTLSRLNILNDIAVELGIDIRDLFVGNSKDKSNQQLLNEIDERVDVLRKRLK